MGTALENAIFTQTFCNERNLVCKKLNPAFSPSGYMEGGIWWVCMHAKNNRFLALYQPCRSVQFKMVSVCSEKPISTLSCLRSFPNITLETVPMCIILWQRPMDPFQQPLPFKKYCHQQHHTFKPSLFFLLLSLGFFMWLPLPADCSAGVW